MKASVLGCLALTAMAIVTLSALGEGPSLYRADTRTWINSPVPRIVPPSFSSATALQDSSVAPPHECVLTEKDEKDKNGKKENGNNNDKKNGKEEEEEDAPENIKDNSFLIEEAYNQEPGVVQHIFNWIGLWDHDHGKSREFLFNQVMELPIGCQDHQFSFVVPFVEFYERPAGGVSEEQGGLSDILLNYRYQLVYEDPCSWRPAIAPRFSLIVPSGDESRGLGVGELGYQLNLPISKERDPFAFHFNAGFTYFSDVSVTLAGGGESPGRDLRGYNLGASVIWLPCIDFNILVELVAFFNEGLDETGDIDRTTEVILNPGFRYAIYTEGELQWVIGVGTPIGLSSDAPDYGVFGYMSVEHAFKKKKEEKKNGCESQ